MTTLREAAQQALEALENSSPDQYPEDAGVFYDAKDALRAALEQPHCATQDCMPSKCSLAAQNTEQDRVLVEMEHALNEADAIMEEVAEETADAWRKRWGYLWGKKV
jgi:uncharacterized protein YyaL (SSP411 family)